MGVFIIQESPIEVAPLKLHSQLVSQVPDDQQQMLDRVMVYHGRQSSESADDYRLTGLVFPHRIPPAEKITAHFFDHLAEDMLQRFRGKIRFVRGRTGSLYSIWGKDRSHSDDQGIFFQPADFMTQADAESTVFFFLGFSMRQPKAFFVVLTEHCNKDGHLLPEHSHKYVTGPTDRESLYTAQPDRRLCPECK